MRTKPFLLATAGSTVDGRVIDDKLLSEMASSYNPQTYGARLNIEHIRGISGQAPFRAYGDVLELSTAEVEVDFNGKTEKRLGLYGVFDVTDEAKDLNEAGQKVYPSIEIEPNFGGQGHAYLMGCALTDSPASIATERLQFNRQMPGTIHLSRDSAALLDLADDKPAGTEDENGFIARFGTMLESTFAKFAPKDDNPDPKPKDDKPGEQQAFAIADMKPLFEQLGQSFSSEIGSLREEFRSEIDQLGVKLRKVEAVVEEQPAQTFTPRPRADGDAKDMSKAF